MGKENSQGLDVGWDIHIHLKIPYELQVVREGERANGLNWYLVAFPNESTIGTKVNECTEGTAHSP